MSRFVDLRWAPLTYFEIVGARTNEEMAYDFANVRASLELCARERRRVVAIVDLRRAAGMDARQRRQQSDWMQATEQLQREVIAGMVCVFSSALIRGVMTALIWLRPPVVVQVNVGTVDDALTWAIDRCDLEGIPVPARLRTERAAVLQASDTPSRQPA
jgi:hypothetical protein